ncbi:hypothetical protein Q9966_014938 [Columba livia]|nr:hypothetical protein Q9966_014938 [Columba livia]
METPLDVLSRAASLVHADDEKRDLIFQLHCESEAQTADVTPYLTVLTQPEQSFPYGGSISLTSGNSKPRLFVNNMTYVIRLLGYRCPPDVNG